MVEVEVQGISLDINNTPVLLLKDRERNRVLPIWVGPIEASSITYAIRGEPFERPLTLDIIKRIIQGLGARVQKVVISGLEGNTYYASMFLEREGNLISIDIRPSDSVAIAVHTRAPIFVDESLMDAHGRELSEDEKVNLEELRERLRGTDPEQFGDFKL